ncbi:MAG: hypothetical protein ACRDSO_10755 [Pseudonocardiaceae bacterium]
MNRGRYATWGEGLAEDDFAKALAAVGLAAANAAGAQCLTNTGGGLTAATIADRVGSALRDRDPATALAWRDPLLAAEWDPATTAPAATWAAAWDQLDLTPPIRLALELSPDGAAADWLTTTFSGPAVLADSSFVTLGGAGVPPPWRFPLRIGFLDQPGGRALRDELIAGFAESSGQATLIEPMIVGRERVVCDLLVLSDPPGNAIETVAGVRELRAAAVLGIHRLDPWDGALVAGLADLTGAWAVGFCAVPDPARWLVWLAQELSHDQSLDQAYARTASQWGGVIAARPEVVSEQRVARRAAAVADSVRHVDRIDPDRGASAVFNDSALAAAAVEVSQMVERERHAAPIIEQAAAARWLQACITASDRPQVPLSRFRAGTTHRVAVHVGPRTEGSLVAETPFPEDRLPSSGPHSLTVVLTEPHLLERPLIDHVVLPMVGTSTIARFRLVTRPDTVTVDARIIVLSGNRVLQTARLPSAVDVPDDRPGDPPAESSAVADAARPETFVAPATSHLGERRTFDAAFVVNSSEDGTSRATAVAGDEAAVVALDDATLTGALTKIAKRLAEIVVTPGDFESLDAPGTVELLIFLAFHGSLMRQALVKDARNLAVLLGKSRYLQVVSAKPDAFFPFELAYDFTAPNEDATLCPAARAALASEDLESGCPGEHTAGTVCPFGFWAVTRVIERHAFQPAGEVTGEFMLRGRPARDRDRIPLGPAIFAASDRVDAFAAGSIDTIVTALRNSAGSHNRVSTWEEWSDAVAARQPALLMMLPHTVFSDVFESFGLEIGQQARRWSAQIDATFVPPQDRPVIVALLGCETARAGEVGYERFPGLLRRAGAEVVIATLTEVLGRHAAPVAAQLVEELYSYCAAQPHGFGEVMVRLRRRLLAQGLIMVLTLAAFGDADWLVTKAAS